MRICFYAPFKPLGHPNPSGDLIIATGLYDFLVSQGHTLLIASELRSRWIYLKPWRFPTIIKERIRTARRIQQFSPDLWLTYHCYYKAPDLLGPALSKKFNIPYCIFQGIYSTKQRRSPKGKIGFYLNRHGLLEADRLFSNRKVDQINLKRIIPSQRLTYIQPGIFPEQFCFDRAARDEMRKIWQVDKEPVILSAAMFRPDVKTQGIIWMLKALARLAAGNIPFKLVIAGDGSERGTLVQLAQELLPTRVIFSGKIERDKMHRFYSGGDLFVFPGIRESLGMVFLEAQSCGLPVIAFDNGGIPEIVRRDKTAYLTPPFDEDAFCRAVKELLVDTGKRHRMGKAAAEHVRTNHDLHRNYLHFEQILKSHVQTA
jgi:glycosyltransferase involved in cell wall biosynthesis